MLTTGAQVCFLEKCKKKPYLAYEPYRKNKFH